MSVGKRKTTKDYINDRLHQNRKSRKKDVIDEKKKLEDFLEEKDNDEFSDLFCEEDDDEELDSIKEFLESISENKEKEKSKNTKKMTDKDLVNLVMENLALMRSRRGNSILVVDLSNSEYESLEENGLLPFVEIDEFELKKVSNRFSDSTVDMNKKNELVDNFFDMNKVDSNELKNFTKNITSLTCAPKLFASAVKSNFANEYTYKEQVFKYEILDSFLKENCFEIKEEYISKLKGEIKSISSFNFIRKEFLKKFIDAYNLIDSYSLEEIKYYTRLIK